MIRRRNGRFPPTHICKMRLACEQCRIIEVGLLVSPPLLSKQLEVRLQLLPTSKTTSNAPLVTERFQSYRNSIEEKDLCSA